MLDLFLRHPFMSSVGEAACTPQAFVDAMCRVEIALARVQEDAGLLAAGTAAAIADQIDMTAFDLDALAADSADGGNVAIPFVKQAKAMLAADLRASFHRGATSQDIVDSALMLVLKPRLARCIKLLGQCRGDGLALMTRHENTPMIGRTLMQQALPITFGAKVAQWLWGLAQAERRLAPVARDGLLVQLGGPVGTHTGFADTGLDLMDALAGELGLACPVLPWHTDRQPILALGDALGAVAVAGEKIALDVALMAQTEVGEVSEPASTGAGGSSSMPHKRNPVGCARIRAAARQVHSAVALLHNAGAQPMERGLGEWHAEWAPLVDAVLFVEGALETLQQLLAGLDVHTQAMRRNLALTGGAILTAPITAFLAERVAHERAAELVAQATHEAAESHRELADILLDHAEISAVFDAEAVRAAVDPAAHTGASAAQVARVRRALESF
ncbi:class-II fumarase/aspartase family protein [Salinisphaera orenii]|uniref:3-carboxy-cis,cis-muconate cycloisomerase n=1 Tax=Salinisphaera orenii YIM 95161 TaxID=1051139 RepID=A0A423PTR5_9GAMM|nr:adenylosuccinate lyase family protein [Salinisphaera halophila]ROO28983.1 3-carboxy-cis,cis-muconate cycloisomerase [Salinisphaera halophila YIM 95161]